MVFQKEYLFESEETERKRKMRIFFTTFFAILFVLIFLPLIHHLYMDHLITQSKEKFFRSSPDVVAVFTGDQGRVKRAFELSKQYFSSKFLISGVYTKNTLMTLIKANYGTESENLEADLLSRIIEIDFEAQDTVENVRRTLEFLRKNKVYETVLIISSDYHLPRIEFILSLETKPEDKHFKFYYESIDTDNFFSYLKNIYIEQLKFILVLFK